MAWGDHIFVDRGAISHHGIDVGGGEVIHFSGTDGTKEGALICRSTLGEFLGGGEMKIQLYGTRLSPEITVWRAESMLGESGYNLFSNNCEHFASWCAADIHSSAQVEGRLAQAAIVSIGVVGPPLAVTFVARNGGAVSRSGANLISGLAKMGGGAKGGMIVLAGASATATITSMCFALRDKPSLPDDERRARQFGRAAAVFGGVTGAMGSVWSVGAMGVSGYSAAGITSGLAQLGGLIGGGMTYGIGLLAFVPPVLAALLGLLVYNFARWLLAQNTLVPGSQYGNQSPR